MACSGATPPAALADVTNRGGAAPGEPLPKRPRLGSPSPAPPAPGPAPPAAASPTVGSPGKGGGLPGVGSPTKTAPLAMRDTPRVASRRAVPPPPPPAKPSRNARPRPKFTPKSTNLQALWQNSWHDISIVAGPHERGDDRCYDVVLHDGNSVLTEWPEGLIRRAAGAAAPSQPTDGQLKRFPLGCIVWARVKGAHDWSPGWVIEMPKGEAPPHMRNNLDAYCVQLFGSGLYAFVEDTYDDTDICPFDVEPPRSEDRLMFTADADQKIAAIQQALQIYFHGMSPETQEGVLRWRGPLRIVHRMISRMNGLWDQAAKAEALELTISELQAQLEANTQHQLCLEQDNAMLRQQVDGSGTRSLGRRLSAVSRMESENLELQRQVALLQGELQQGCRPAEVAGDPELVGRLRGDVAALEAQRDHFRALIEESAAALEEQTKAAAHWQEQCAARDATIAARDATIAVRDAAIAGLEAERRRLRYAILELKGNLRVVCRVRPPTAQEAQQPLALFRFPEDDTLQLCPADGRAQHSFRLDRVFQPAASNADVFHEVAPLVQSVLDGYNVCLFTYGQTGSGKTFTMAGPPEANDEAPVAEKDVGLIPRAMELIFANIEQLRGEGWDHEVAVKVVEIHNEVVYDLLPPPEPGTTCPGASPFRTPLQRPRPSKASATPTAAGRPAGWRPLATPSTPSTPGTAGLKAGKTSSPSVRVTVSEPKVVAAHTQIQQTFSVASLADAEALSPDGYFHGMPIEVRGLGLYAELKGHLAPHPGTSSVQAKPKSSTNGPLSAVPNGLASVQPSHTVANRTPEAPGGRKASCDLRDAPVVAPRTTPRSPLSDGTAATPSKSPGQRPLFHESAFKAHYNATPAPEYPHQLLEAVHALVVGYAARKGLERPKAEAFFRELQDTAFRNVEELLSDIQAVAGRIWTSPRRLEEMEFCFILNDVLRCDMAELMQPAATITRAINLLLVNARLCGGVAGTVYRGGGLPDEHRGFFTPRKTYRIPMFLATTIDQQTSKDKFCRRADLKFRLPPVLWIIELGREIGCMHVNYLHMSECHGEQEYLFAPYSAFTVDEVAWKAKPTWQDPHVVRLTAVSDNRLAPETLPLAPWA